MLKICHLWKSIKLVNEAYKGQIKALHYVGKGLKSHIGKTRKDT